MTFDWNTGNEREFVIKLALWLFWSLGETAVRGGEDLLGSLRHGDHAQLALVAPIGIGAVWLVTRLIKLILLGGLVTATGLLAAHFLLA